MEQSVRMAQYTHSVLPITWETSERRIITLKLLCTLGVSNIAPSLFWLKTGYLGLAQKLNSWLSSATVNGSIFWARITFDLVRICSIPNQSFIMFFINWCVTVEIKVSTRCSVEEKLPSNNFGVDAGKNHNLWLSGVLIKPSLESHSMAVKQTDTNMDTPFQTQSNHYTLRTVESVGDRASDGI